MKTRNYQLPINGSNLGSLFKGCDEVKTMKDRQHCADLCQMIVTAKKREAHDLCIYYSQNMHALFSGYDVHKNANIFRQQAICEKVMQPVIALEEECKLISSITPFK